MVVSSNEPPVVQNVSPDPTYKHRDSLSHSSDISNADDFLEQHILINESSDRQPSNWRDTLPFAILPWSHGNQRSTRSNKRPISYWKAAVFLKGGRWRPWIVYTSKAVLVLVLVFLLSTLVVAFYSDDIRSILDVWGKPEHIGYGLSTWPTDFTRGILPIPCHSHNDYWRRVPLYSAISAGCISVEADIWLFDDELYVGHSISSLTPNRTLDSLYINPLLDILSKQNPTTSFHNGENGLDGVFDTTPSQSLILLIDFKTSGPELWPYVLSALQPLRDHNYLTHLEGTQIIRRPITVVGTGNTSFDLITSKTKNPHSDIFFDAPLDEIYKHRGDDFMSTSKSRHPEERSNHNSSNEIAEDEPTKHNRYTTSNSFYASVSFRKVFGHLNQGRFSNKQLEILRGQLKAAHNRGLKARYWDLPYWPISFRNHVWDILVKEGVDLLNVDDLKGATQIDWTKPEQGFW